MLGVHPKRAMRDESGLPHDETPDTPRGFLIRADALLQARLRSFAAFRRALKRRVGMLDPARLDLYLGYATDQFVRLRGRALEDPPLVAPRREDNTWTNIRRSIRLLETDEIPHIDVEVRFRGQIARTTTDRDGYFDVSMHLATPLASGWHPYTATTLGHEKGPAVEGAFLVPPRSARYAVISDIDDTILQTHVRNTAKMVWVTLLGNALTRLSFDGAPQLYHALCDRGAQAPFFYVSRSAWNIHALLEQFVEHQGFPRGPLLLRNAGAFSPPPEAKTSKRDQIEMLLSDYDYPFVCVGDSGQRDADIYTQLSRMYPDRILAILIRDLGGRNTTRVRRILNPHAECPCLLFRQDQAALDWLGERNFFAA